MRALDPNPNEFELARRRQRAGHQRVYRERLKLREAAALKKGADAK
jgi:hypothetical protein